MRVLQLSTSGYGGAGLSASILNERLLESGITGKLITRPDLQLQDQVRSKVATLMGKLSSSSGYDFLSSHSVSTINIKDVAKYEPQIIHVHNWYNLLNVEDFFRLAEISPLVFTLHDERLATGGCHVPMKCERYIGACDNCPAHRLGLSRKKYKEELDAFFSAGTAYGVISPSRWLMNKLQQTELIKNAVVTEAIPNHVSMVVTTLPIYEPRPNEARLLFVASNLDASFKGLELLLLAMRYLDSEIENLDRRVTLKLVGNLKSEIPDNYKNLKIMHEAHVTTDALVNHLKMADILIVPSLWENYPGVIAESQLQGTRVVANRVGGISEMVEDQRSGYLADPDPKSLASKILEAILDPNAEKIRMEAFKCVTSRQNPEEINNRHLAVYRKLMNTPGA